MSSNQADVAHYRSRTRPLRTRPRYERREFHTSEQIAQPNEIDRAKPHSKCATKTLFVDLRRRPFDHYGSADAR